VSRPFAIALLGAAVVGCSSGELPPPNIVSVEPSTRAASASGQVTVVLDAVLPTFADYGANSATVDDRMTLRIGSRIFGPAHWTDGGVITDFLPSVLPDGQYDVSVELGRPIATASNASL
jgi:hypothetical protein